MRKKKNKTTAVEEKAVVSAPVKLHYLSFFFPTVGFFVPVASGVQSNIFLFQIPSVSDNEISKVSGGISDHSIVLGSSEHAEESSHHFFV